MIVINVVIQALEYRTADKSDSLNISPCARWVVCPLSGPCAPEGTGRTAGGIYTPGGFENTENIPCSNHDCRFPAAWQLGQQRE